MRESDLVPFGQMLDAVCSLLSRGQYAPNAANTALWFRALADHPLEVVRAAFDAHVKDPQRGRFVPTPADLLAHIVGAGSDDGRPGADEAWATALLAQDEHQTVVWSDETSAAFAIARSVLEAGDKVGARMAFRDAYDRLTSEARKAGRALRYTVSLGFDSAQRDAVVAAAVQAGKLGQSELLALPAPASVDRLATGLWEERFDADVSALAARDKLRELAATMRERSSAILVDTTARDATNAAKAAVAQRVSEYRAGQS